jgi:Mg-chelatase subunit ChlD
VQLPDGTAKVAFRVDRKGEAWWTGYRGNIAIDKVIVECGGAPPAPPAPPPGLCSDECGSRWRSYASNGFCDDGGAGSEYYRCSFGSDCNVRGTAGSNPCATRSLLSRTVRRASDCAGLRRPSPPSPMSARHGPRAPKAAQTRAGQRRSQRSRSRVIGAGGLWQVLVLDKSGSMWYYHSQLKDFARSVLHQFKIGPDSTAMALVEFSSNSRVLRVGGTSGLSYDAAALEQEISEMDAPRGMTNIEAGLEKGLEVMLGTNSRPNVRHRIMILLTDGEQTVGGGTPAAIEKAKQIKAEGDLTLISVGFGGVKETTVQALASAPASENAFKGNDIQAIMEHFSNLCSVIDSPKPPPSPGPPALPPSPSDPWWSPPSSPSPPFAPPSICENTCAYASDGTCDDGGAGSEYDLCTVR